jgi:heptosyltransferase-3
MLVKGKTPLPRIKGAILLIQLGDIGDVVLTMPTIKALRENFPENNITVCVREKARELIEDCPWVNGVISVEKQKRNLKEEFIWQKNFITALWKHPFDLVFELRTGTRGAIIAFFSGASNRIGRFAEDGRLWRNRVFTHLVWPQNEIEEYVAEHSLNILAPFNLNTTNRSPFLFVPLHRKEKGCAILRNENIPIKKPIIALHPFSLWRYKEWKIDQCVRLIEHIGNTYPFAIIVTGAEEEHERAGELVAKSKIKVYNLAGKTTIGVLPAVLQACRLFIGVDTAALHIAAAVGTPTIGIFGPSSPINWAPRGDHHIVVSKDRPCVPCRQKGCQNSEISQCLEELTFAEIKEKVDQHIMSCI